jgi:hypothetical protein
LTHATINYLPSTESRLPSEYLYYLKNHQGVDENIADVMAQRVEKCHETSSDACKSFEDAARFQKGWDSEKTV